MHDTENPTVTPETTNTTPPEPAPAAPTTETDKARRERASYPIRLLPQIDATTYGPPLDGVSFATIEQAERWVRDSGMPGLTYMLARVIGGRRMPPRTVEDVTL